MSTGGQKVGKDVSSTQQPITIAPQPTPKDDKSTWVPGIKPTNKQKPDPVTDSATAPEDTSGKSTWIPGIKPSAKPNPESSTGNATTSEGTTGKSTWVPGVKPTDKTKTDSTTTDGQATGSEGKPETTVDQNQKPNADVGVKTGEHRQHQPQSQPATAPADAILSARPFIIKAFLWSAASNNTAALEATPAAPTIEATTSLHSATLDTGVLRVTKDAKLLTLAQLRTQIGPMSRFTRIHKFCTLSGILIPDENLTLSQYFAVEHTASTSSVPELFVYYRTLTANPITRPEAVLQGAPQLTQFDGAKAGLPNTGAWGATTGALIPGTTQLPATQMTANVAELVPKTGANPQISASTLTEEQWERVLRNCAVFYGWTVDRETRQIRRAPKPAFQLRSEQTSRASSTVTVIQEGNDHVKPVPPLESKPEASVTVKEATEQLSPSSAADNSNKESPLKPVNDTKSQAQDADGRLFVPATAEEALEALELPSERAARLKKIEAAKQVEQARAAAQTAAAFANIPVVPAVQKINKVFPNFRINDDSKIEITVCRHEMAVSMAKNDFSSQSTEASVSGGVAGITAGVSAGYAGSQFSSSKNSNASSTQTMVARYMFPRCDLFLYPGDLEPTPELARLLDVIRQTKDIKTLRKVQADYGQLFCQEVTLGARLLSTKTMTSIEATKEEEQKEQFKVSVGVSVSTPYGGASVKHEQEKGSSTASSSMTKDSREANVFEAVGGDTLLASNPNAWTYSVAAPESWRIINREGLSSMIGMISQMQGYSAVQSWFVQAVPALSKYVLLDETKRVTARFKVTSPGNALAVSNLDGNAQHYLAFHPDDHSNPRLNTISTSNFWIRMESTVSKPIFHPESFRAPVIRGFAGFNVGGTAYGASYNKDFAAVTWTITAPFGEHLAHGSRVVLQTMPWQDLNNKPVVGGTDNTAPSSHMVVFRNAQGEFLPGMSDHDEAQFWRIVKKGAAKQDEPIQSGDEVRLCWSFKDQNIGYRDYCNDTFGRRVTQRPSNIPDALYLKVPWPRYENLGTPTTMIMGQDETTEPYLADTTTMHGTFKYMMQDLSFRIDVVELNGKADANDYLLKGLGRDNEDRIEAFTKEVPTDYGFYRESRAGTGLMPALMAGSFGLEGRMFSLN